MFVLFQPRATRLKLWKPKSLPRATRRSKVVAEDHKEAKVVAKGHKEGKVVAEGHKEGKAKVVAEGHKERVPRGGIGRCRGLHGYLDRCQGPGVFFGSSQATGGETFPVRRRTKLEYLS
jgi:hypothetical protein